MVDEELVNWAQNELWTSQVLSESELAWRCLITASLDGRKLPPRDALEIAHDILRRLTPPTSALMERSGWGGDRHHALVRYAYARATKKWTPRKVWVDLELPISPPERRKPPQAPNLTFTPWGRLPRPDIFLEATDESKIWIECQTVASWSSLSQKGKAARQYGIENAYTDFVVVGVSPDDRLLEDLREIVTTCGKKFYYWNPVSDPIPEVGKDAADLIKAEVQTPPYKLGPYEGVERFWAWSGGSNRKPAIISDSVVVPIDRSGGLTFFPFRWPKNCPECSGRGSSCVGTEEVCPRCGGFGSVPRRNEGIGLCPQCWGAQSIPTVPCGRCQGRGWEWSTLWHEIQIPSFDFFAQKGSYEMLQTLHPDDRRSRKAEIKIYPKFSSEGPS